MAFSDGPFDTVERPEGAEFWPLLACAALAGPMLLAYNVSPSATFFNQAAAFIGWGGWLALLAAPLRLRSLVPQRGLALLLGAFVLLLAASLGSPLWTGLPWALALGPAATLAAAAWAAWVGAALARQGLAVPAFRALCIGLVVAGVASALIGIVQVYAPDVADGVWIAHSTIVGRAVGNLRQPNHLSSLLLWSIIAVLWLGQTQALPRSAALAIAALLMFATVLSGSRTGMLGAGLLCVWGLIDARLARPVRLALVLAPVVYALFFEGAAFYAHHADAVFGGEARLAERDISGSRFGIWSNTLALIRMHPWVGVGFGEFNLAWSLTPFPGRPTAFFDHTHNLVLQLVVELGVPLGALVLLLLLAALFAAALRAVEANEAAVTVARAALAMVVMIALHSLLEYPLWYAYFLFPAAFAFGLCLARPAPDAQATRDADARLPAVLLSLALLAGGVFVLRDYLSVVRIFAAVDNNSPLADRIAAGQRSVFFSHHADYAAATTPERPSDAMAAFDGAPHYLLDARLLMAWARAYDEAGDADRARYLAARLAEFRNEQAAEFFAPCVEENKDAAPLPFQCLPPQRALDYRDFRHPR